MSESFVNDPEGTFRDANGILREKGTGRLKERPPNAHRRKMSEVEKALRKKLPEEWAKELKNLLWFTYPQLRAIIAYDNNGLECSHDSPAIRVFLAKLITEGDYRDVIRVIEYYLPKKMSERDDNDNTPGDYDEEIMAAIESHNRFK